MRPLVSVIMPAYNASEWLEDALNSIVASDYRPIEVIVMDDGSKDDTLTKAQSFAAKYQSPITNHQSPIISVYSQPNSGASAARNNAIKHSHGTYILPVDADNIIDPRYISEAVEVLEKRPEVKVVSCRADFFGDKTGEWKFPPFSKQLLARKNMIDTCAMYRRADYDRTTGYMEHCIAREDWDFWLSIFEHGGEFVRLPEIRLHYRVRTGSKRITDRQLKRQVVDAVNARHPEYMRRYLGGPLHYHRSWSRFLNFFRSEKQVGDFNRWTEGTVIDARRNILRLTDGVVVKQFRTPSLWRGLIYGLFVKSKARRSYEYALKLNSLPITGNPSPVTPDPISYREIRICGILRESWYACKQSDCKHTFIDLIQNPNFPNREQILRAIGRFTAQLHQLGVWHPDYSQGNILFNDDASHIEIVDLNRIRWKKHPIHKYPFERLERIGPEGIKALLEGYEQV